MRAASSDRRSGSGCGRAASRGTSPRRRCAAAPRRRRRRPGRARCRCSTARLQARPSTRNSGASACSSFSATTRQSASSLQVADHDHELVGAGARQRVGLAHAAREALRDLAQHGVARAMAERVVHLAEIVQVVPATWPPSVAALREPDRLAQPVVEQAPVRQPGERVVVGEEARRLLGAAQLGDVGDQLDAAAALEPAAACGATSGRPRSGTRRRCSRQARRRSSRAYRSLQAIRRPSALQIARASGKLLIASRSSRSSSALLTLFRLAPGSRRTSRRGRGRPVRCEVRSLALLPSGASFCHQTDGATTTPARGLPLTRARRRWSCRGR